MPIAEGASQSFPDQPAPQARRQAAIRLVNALRTTRSTLPRSATRGYSNPSAGTRVLSREFLHQAYEILKCQRNLVRTGVRTSVAHFICERARRGAADAIGVETVVPGGGDQAAVAVNVDTVRSRAAPGQIRSASPVYQVATRTERDLARCRCRCERWSHGRSGRRCGSRRGCRCGRRCGCWARCRRRGRCRRGCRH